MSATITGLVWDRAPHRDATLLTLLALADAADDTGQGTLLLAHLAHRARQTHADLTTTLQRLEATGLLLLATRLEDAGPRLRFRLALEQFPPAVAPQEVAG